MVITNENSVFEINEAQGSDLEMFGWHLERIINSSGVGKTPFFNPRIAGEFILDDVRKKSISSSWKLKPGQESWSKAWLIKNGSKVVGHINLTASSFKAQSHRCELGIGIEESAAGKGLGTRAMKTAIDWVKNYPVIEYIDLAVFSGNDAAMALYKRFGFIEYGRRQDAFRFKEISVSDIQMTLKLKTP